MKMTESELTPGQLEAIVVAVLAVNQFPLEKAWKLLPNLRASKLTSPKDVCEMAVERRIVLLAEAGYDRGLLTEMFAGRLESLMRAVLDGKLRELPAAVASNDETRACEILRSVKGIGPAVARNSWLLLK